MKKSILFSGKNLNNGVPRGRCRRRMFARNNSTIAVLQANSLPLLGQQVCGLLGYRGRRNCELARLPVRDVRLAAPTRYRNL
jgi:hypothetical protein